MEIKSYRDYIQNRSDSDDDNEWFDHAHDRQDFDEGSDDRTDYN